MQIIKRLMNFEKMLKMNSFFLFGPRGTGKSFWIRHTLPQAKIFDLLDNDVYFRLLRRPRQLGEEISDRDKIVVIDEIQKLPLLLDEVHRLIETRNIRFLLTGSSARKLKRWGVNLLAGRVWQASFFPFLYKEIPGFDIVKYFNRGGLPRAFLSEYFKEELKNYVSLYLTEEIKAEALVRKIDNFSRFLDIIAFQNGKELHYQNISSDCGVPVRTVENYIDVLKDTLIGFEILPFTKTVFRKAITRSKFYLFDIGVTNQLAKRGEILEGSQAFGECFEHWLILEIRAFLSLTRKDKTIFYWRSTTGFEVDCIIENLLAVELKATNQIHERHLKGLKALREEGLIKNYAIVSTDPVYRIIDGIKVYHWRKFLDDLWAGKII